MKNVALLGVTGSIGQSALDVVAQYPERYRVWAIAAGSNVEKLARLASVWRPYVVAIADQSRYNALVKELKHLGINDIRVMAGSEAMCEIASMDQVDIVVQAIVGAAGVKPSFAAARAGKRLLLANKESVVCGGELLISFDAISFEALSRSVAHYLVGSVALAVLAGGAVTLIGWVAMTLAGRKPRTTTSTDNE